MKRLWVLGALFLVAGDEARRLAPGPAELAASATEAENRVAQAEATGVAVVRLQNAWGELLATGKAPKKPCEDDAASGWGRMYSSMTALPSARRRWRISSAVRRPTRFDTSSSF